MREKCHMCMVKVQLCINVFFLAFPNIWYRVKCVLFLLGNAITNAVQHHPNMG